MAEVKTIDIDGIQWEIKDQTARNKIAEIEKNISTQDLPDAKLDIDKDCNVLSIEANNHYKIGKIHFIQIHIINIASINIGTHTTARVASSELIPKKDTSFILLDNKAPATARGFLGPDGSIYLGETVGIQSGDNDMYGEIIFAEP